MITNTENQPKFAIGQKFTVKGRGYDRCYVVTDIYITRNLAGAMVKLEYQTEHSLAGQSISELVCETTIARALAYVRTHHMK
jgi:hypothetical protein